MRTTRPASAHKARRPYRVANAACPRCDGTIIFFPSTRVVVCPSCSSGRTLALAVASSAGKGGAA